MKRLSIALAAAAALAAVSSPTVAAPLFADVVAIVDESGSMAGEHAWLGSMVGSLESGLVGAGLTGGNRYGLTGFGAANSGGHSVVGHTHSVGGAAFGTAAQFATATTGLVLSGGTEDGWDGIDHALTSYTYRAGAARNFILVTDEDRDNANNALSYAGILGGLTSTGTLLNAVVNATFRCGNTSALGISGGGIGYIANGSGGFTTATGCSATGGFGTTIADYVNLALASGGAAWDLNQLRLGGLVGTSFTNAFVDIKVQEITNQTPEPGSLALVGAALGIGGLLRRRRNAAAA